MNPKLHESKELNEITNNQNSEYINIAILQIVAGSVYYISGTSEMPQIII